MGLLDQRIFPLDRPDGAALRDELARQYPRAVQAQALGREAGIPVEYLSFADSGPETWLNVLALAARTGRLRGLIAVIMADGQSAPIGEHLRRLLSEDKDKPPTARTGQADPSPVRTRLTVRWSDGGDGLAAPWAFAPGPADRRPHGGRRRSRGEHRGPRPARPYRRRRSRLPAVRAHYRHHARWPAHGAPVGDRLDRPARPERCDQQGHRRADRDAAAGGHVAPWAGPNVNELSVDPSVAVSWAGDAVTISRQSDSAVSLAIDIATRFMPRRQLAVPPVGPADACTLSWHQGPGSVPRPRVEPDDPGGQLLMGYLLAGQYSLAAAAARGIETARAAASLIAWSAPSYTQLLIGYAYALAEIPPGCRLGAGERRRRTCWAPTG